MLSCTPSYVESLQKTAPRTYKSIKSLHENIEKPLAAILTLNTFSHTIGATGAGAQVQILFGNEWMTLFSIILTLAILFLSEILPKSIGARYWPQLLPFAGLILPKLVVISYPLVVVSDWMSRLIKGNGKSKVSREEFRAFTDIGLHDGTLSPVEHKIFHSIISFPESKIRDIMTPAKKVVGFYENTTAEEAFNIIKETQFSRLLLFGQNRDEVDGYVLRDDLLLNRALDKDEPIGNMMKPIFRVPDTMNVRSVFLRMLSKRQHIAAVLDDQSQFVGVVSLEDLLETLLDFEIVDELDREQQVQQSN